MDSKSQGLNSHNKDGCSIATAIFVVDSLTLEREK